MKHKNKFGRILAGCLALLLMFQLSFPVYAESTAGRATETIYIHTEEEFLALVDACSLDTWSIGKKVVLQADISLDNTDFLPIPTFGGTFDGCGHRISGLTITESITPAGLFGILQEGASVKNLNVSGTVSPSGDTETVGGIVGRNFGTVENCTYTGTVSGKRNTGGIAGCNELSGKIKNCSVSGAVYGKAMTGGIAGCNLGEISFSQSDAGINITSVDPSLSPDDINFDFLTDISKLYSLDTSMAASDTGGIAGYSSGILSCCVNRGTVGYPHIGYNAGGIAGRSCGYLYNCSNQASVYGRKDVGGIVGQVEPYIAINLSENTLAQLDGQMDGLNTMINHVLDDADSSAGTVTARLNSIADCLDDAADAISEIKAYGSIDSLITGSGQANSSGSITVTPPGFELGGSSESSAGGSITITPPGSATDKDEKDKEKEEKPGSGESAEPEKEEEPVRSDDDFPANAPDNRNSEELPLENMENESGERVFPAFLNGETEEENDTEAGEQEENGEEDPENLPETTPPLINMEAGASSEGEIHGGLTPGSVEGQYDGSASGIINATTDFVLNTSLHELSSAVSKMTRQMSLLNDELNNASGTLKNDLSGISNQINSISDTLFDAIFGEQTADVVSDTSETNIDSVFCGKSAFCKNQGKVSGDINVGGIAGAMSIEYELDPEDDLTPSLSGRNRRQFELKAILQNCVNYGPVTSKRNYAGSICGRMDMGLITGCEGYGDTESESGDYVGGIAGLTKATIRNCFAKCSLKGGCYVGGIVGSGVSESTTGDSSLVSGCYALIRIPEHEQCAGGISGADAGDFSENYYVGEDLAAINRLSYSGKAEPISYQELLQVEGLPEEFRQFTLRFVAEDEVLQTCSFRYGDSFDESAYPEVPEKDGYYAQWDITELKDLCFDTVVTAVYTPYTSALADSQRRADGRPIFFVEGQFQETDVSAAVKQTPDSSAFGLLSDGMGTALKHYFSFIGKAELPEKTINRKLVEQWSVEIPDDGLSVHNLRYLAPNGKTDHLAIYTKQDGNWIKTDFQTMGSYLVFPVSGTSAELAVVSTLSIWWAWLGACVLLLLIIVLIVSLIRKNKRRKAKKAAALAYTAAAQTEWAETGEAEPSFPHSSEAFGAESDVITLTQEGGKPESAPENDAIQPRKKKRHLLPLILAVLLLFGVTAAAGLFLRTDLRRGMRAYRLLADYADKEELAMDLNVQAEIGKETIGTEALVIRTETDGRRITCVEQNGISLYYSGNTVYLSNGKAFQVNGLFPDYSELLARTAQLYQSVTISESESDSGKTYSIVAEGENAKSVLEILVPSFAEQLSDAQVLRVELTESGRELAEIRFSANGTLNDSGKTAVATTAQLTMQNSDPQTLEVPSEVLEAIQNRQQQAPAELSDSLFRLLSAWSELNSREIQASELQLSADCGPLVLNDSLKLFRTTRDGLEVSCIRKNSLSIYFTDQAICNKDGAAVTTKAQTLAASAKLWEIACQACLNGEFSCSENDSSSIYTLSLDKAGMKAVASAIAPESKDMDIAFSAGSIQITLEEEKMSQIYISCNGSVEVVGVDVPVSLSCLLQIAKPNAELDFSIPQAVMQALRP